MSVDWTDSKALNELANKTIELAGEYRRSRQLYSKARLSLDLILASKYRHKTLERKISYEKALIMLLADEKENVDEVRGYYETMIKSEADYKGLEKVLEAHQNKISLSQSLIKNQIRNT